MNAALARLAPALVDHLWQSTVVALFALLLLTAFRPYLSARVRGILAWMALLKFAVPSALLFPQAHAPALFHFQRGQVIFANGRGTAPDRPGGPPDGPAVQDSLSEKTAGLCAGLWAIGAAGVVLLALPQTRRHSFGAGRPPDDGGPSPSLLHSLHWISPAAGLRMPPAVRIVPATEGPAVQGLLHPQLLMPAGLEDALSPTELRAVLLHELAHLRRRDNLWAALRLPFLAVFWFHPLVWLLSRRIELEAEMACDEAVLAQGVASQAYVAALAKTVRHRLGLLPSSAAAAGTSPLGLRLEAILSHRGPRPWQRRIAAIPLVATFTALCALSTYAGSVTTPIASAGMPTFAQGNERLSTGDLANTAKPLVLQLVPLANHSSDLAPLYCPAPSYPELLRRAGISGQVVLGFAIDTNGAVHDPFVESYDTPEFADAATEAVLNWRYRPAHVAGQPVESQLRLRILFTVGPLPDGIAPEARPVAVSVQPL